MSDALTTARARSGQRKSERTRAANKAVERARMMQCGDYLERVAAALYGSRQPIPAGCGGLLFREVCRELEGAGFEITEAILAKQAFERGLWVARPADVVQAVRPEIGAGR